MMRKKAVGLFATTIAVLLLGCQDPGEPTKDAIVTLLAIPGVPAPATGTMPQTSVVSTQYTGTISWSPSDAPFKASTAYTATITLTAKAGYTLIGVMADSFTVTGAAATNTASTGIITAVFPATSGVEPATLSNLAGTWNSAMQYYHVEVSVDPVNPEEPSVSLEYDCVAAKKRTITELGEYIDMDTVTMTTVEGPITTKMSYEAARGSLSLIEGRATWNQTERAESGSPLVDPIAWIPSESSKTSSIVLIDGKLYIDSAYHRTSAGTGILGTWEMVSCLGFGGSALYTKSTVVFSETTMSVSSEASNDGITYNPSGTPQSFAITYNDDSSLSVGVKKGYYILSGDLLVFGDETAADSAGWVKE